MALDGELPAGDPEGMPNAFGDAPAFRDRRAAGEALAEAVVELPGLVDPIVLALPRGGVPVGHEVAIRLDAPLDVLAVRKIGVPGHEELAMGAVASGGITYLERAVISHLGLTPATVDEVRARESAEVDARSRRYRGGRPWPSLRGRSVILVDDGVATGSTMLAAIAALRPQGPHEIVVAVPVAPAETRARLRAAADRVVCVAAPEDLWAISLWYEDFAQVSDDEVAAMLWGPEAPSTPPG
jgi:predicted phosphoribosyltransferase